MTEFDNNNVNPDNKQNPSEQNSNNQNSNYQNSNNQNPYSQSPNNLNLNSQNLNNQNLNNQNLYNQSPYSQSQYNQNQYTQSPYNQSQYNQNQYNQSPYNQSQYNQSQYNRNQYNQDSLGQNQNNLNSYNQNYYNQNPNNKVPEYSFWAEQAPTNGYSNYNSGIDQNSAKNVQAVKEKKKGNKAIRFVIKALCFGVIAGGSFLGFQALYYAVDPDSAQSRIHQNLQGAALSAEKDYQIGYTESGDVKVELKSAISDVAKTTIPAIVSINSTSTQTSDWFGQQYSEEVEGSGSGFIVSKTEEELLIATNNHVVSGTNKITVTFTDGSEADAVIKGTDATADLAVISVDISTMKNETLDAIAIAKLGNSDDVKVGEMAIAIGNALGYGQSVTVGYISAKDREVEVSDGYDSKTMVLLQTDAAINPGNSGGALLNSEGEVIGINTVKYASNEVEGMGYAIPISRATPIIKELMSREILEEDEQGYLGITGNDVTEEVASIYNMPIGVFINDLAKGSAAEKAGLLPGDIITAVNEVEVTAITQLRDYVTSFRVGTEVEVTYMRSTDGDYKEGKLTVTLGKNPNLDTTQE